MDLCLKNVLYGIFWISATYVKACKKVLKKRCEYLVGMWKSSTFAPAIERDAAVIEILKVKLGSSNLLKKNFLKNFFEKVWWLEIKSLPLHPLSKTIAIKKSSLKDLDMNKQVVQYLL